jgi:hypothetical protein
LLKRADVGARLDAPAPQTPEGMIVPAGTGKYKGFPGVVERVRVVSASADAFFQPPPRRVR